MRMLALPGTVNTPDHWTGAEVPTLPDAPVTLVTGRLAAAAQEYGGVPPTTRPVTSTLARIDLRGRRRQEDLRARVDHRHDRIDGSGDGESVRDGGLDPREPRRSLRRGDLQRPGTLQERGGRRTPGQRGPGHGVRRKAPVHEDGERDRKADVGGADLRGKLDRRSIADADGSRGLGRISEIIPDPSRSPRPTLGRERGG